MINPMKINHRAAERGHMKPIPQLMPQGMPLHPPQQNGQAIFYSPPTFFQMGLTLVSQCIYHAKNGTKPSLYRR